MSDKHIGSPTALVPVRLEERNRIGDQIIQKYANMHAGMDVGVGLVGCVPGLAIPALITALSAQAPVIYQPLARELAAVYLADPGQLESADEIIAEQNVATGQLDVAADFGANFIFQMVSEHIGEMGMGFALSFVPFLGAAVGAGLDYVIATKMTRRVGYMVSMYFQNDGHWVKNKEHTYELSKNMDGNLNGIRSKVSQIQRSQVKNVRFLVQMMRASGIQGDAGIRAALSIQGVPTDLIEDALRA